MNQQAQLYSINTQMDYFGQATVSQEENAEGLVHIAWTSDNKSLNLKAVVAVNREKPLAINTRVLISGNHIDHLFVIGLIDIQTQSTKQIISDDNQLIFEYDPVTKKAMINLDEGDITFNTKSGSVRFNASETIELQSNKVNIKTKNLSIKSFVSDMVFSRMETTVDTLVENAKNVYRTVKQLSQLHSGRQRTFVEETYQLNADKVLIKSENDVKVKAEKIHLG